MAASVIWKHRQGDLKRFLWAFNKIAHLLLSLSASEFESAVNMTYNIRENAARLPLKTCSASNVSQGFYFAKGPCVFLERY